MNKIYRPLYLFNITTPLFYFMRIPLIVYYVLKCWIFEKKNVYFEVLKIVNIVRQECLNYADKDVKKGTYNVKIYYRFNDKTVDIKVRFFRKMTEEYYDRFMNAISLYSGYDVVDYREKGYFCFGVIMNFDPIYKMKCTDTTLTLGTYYKGLYHWNFALDPHLLIVGNSGSGKSVAMCYLLNAIIHQGYDITLIDGKKVDWIELENKIYRYHSFVDVKGLLEVFSLCRGEMKERQEKMAKLKIKNYREMSDIFPPKFIIIEEFSAIQQNADKKQVEALTSFLRELMFLGRALGFFIIMTMQRADGKYLDTSIRDNFACRMVLGSASKSNYEMVFEDRNIRKLSVGQAWLQTSKGRDRLAIPYYKNIEFSTEKSNDDKNKKIVVD